MTMLTRQEIFTKVWNGLKAQGWQRSVTGAVAGGCMYRGKDGMKCAAGHLISDEQYHLDLEGRGAISYEVAMVLQTCGVGEQDIEFVALLQNYHDCGHESSAMERGFRVVATSYDLTIPGE